MESHSDDGSSSNRRSRVLVIFRVIMTLTVLSHFASFVLLHNVMDGAAGMLARSEDALKMQMEVVSHCGRRIHSQVDALWCLLLAQTVELSILLALGIYGLQCGIKVTSTAVAAIVLSLVLAGLCIAKVTLLGRAMEPSMIVQADGTTGSIAAIQSATLVRGSSKLLIALLTTQGVTLTLMSWFLRDDTLSQRAPK